MKPKSLKNIQILILSMLIAACGSRTQSSSDIHQVDETIDAAQTQSAKLSVSEFNPELCEAGEILVLTKSGVEVNSISAMQRLSQNNGLNQFRALSKPKAGAKKQAHDFQRIQLLDIDTDKAGSSTQELLDELNEDPNVLFAEPNCEMHAFASTNDPMLGAPGMDLDAYVWGVHDADSIDAWDLATGEGVIVAVLDTGVDYNHGDLQANIYSNPNEIANNGVDDDNNGYIDDVQGWDFTENDNDVFDGNSHGTHVSGTIAAAGNNNLGVVGVAYNAKVMGVKVLADSGGGAIDGIAQGIEYAADNGAHIINMSLGGPFNSNTICLAISAAYNAGTLTIVAAGNENQNAANVSPAACNQAITVASHEFGDTKSSFSNFGETIEVSAPGSTVLSTVPNGGYDDFNGTSMASPHAAGVAALILSANPFLGVQDIWDILVSTTTDIQSPGEDDISGSGKVNAKVAVEMALSDELTLPTIEVEPVVQLSVGDTAVVSVTATNPIDSELILSASNLPEGASFNAETGLLTWLTGEDSLAINSVQFTASNAMGEASANTLIEVEGGIAPSQEGGGANSFVQSSCRSQSDSLQLAIFLFMTFIAIFLMGSNERRRKLHCKSPKSTV